MVPELVLDPSLRYWVLLPISAAMVLVGILRTYITVLIQPSFKLVNWKVLREQSHLQKAVNFRQNCFILPTQQDFEIRQQYISENLKSLKYLSKPPPKEDELPPNPLSDPASTDALFQMFKSNLMNYIPQTVIMWWVNYFFAGFIIMKLPFPLTLRFKSMLQNGVNTQDLDVRWVSSLSWYFVNLLGLRAIYALILGSDEIIEDGLQQQSSQQQQQQAAPPPALQGAQVVKMMQGEAENVMIAPFKSCLDDVEDRILKMYSLQN